MKPKSLQDFAKDNPTKVGPSAWITTIPEWPEIVEAYKSGVRLTVIRRWLVEERGYPDAQVTYQRVSHLASKFGPLRGPHG